MSENRNTGNHNTGNHNTGDYNTGNRNTGDYNTGNHNTGDYNTGNRNTGDYNTGDYNTGNRNTGDCNTGDCNTGNFNTGDCNTGDCNTGNFNTGDWNMCNYSTGFFNTVEQPLYMFDKLVDGVSRSDINIYLPIDLTEWILPEKMTEKEKRDNPGWETSEGYLKELNYQEACKIAWSNADQATKDRFLNLPNFNSEIFKKITGIDVKVKAETINIDGVQYTLSEIKKALKK